MNPDAPIGRAPDTHHGATAAWADAAGRWEIEATSSGADGSTSGAVTIRRVEPYLSPDSVRGLVVDLVSAGRVAESTVHIGWSDASKGRVAATACGRSLVGAHPFYPTEIDELGGAGGEA